MKNALRFLMIFALSVLLAVGLASAVSAANMTHTGYCGAGSGGKNLIWLRYDDGTLIIDGNGKMQDYSSSSSITSAPWGAYAGSLKSLIIGDGVTSIGRYAFYNCTGFTGNLVIPDSVTSIGERAFRGCTGFTGNLVIPDSVTTIGNYAFSNCRGFTGDLVIPDSVTAIGDYAFYNCSGFTGDLVIPDSVTTIGDCAFNGCSKLTDIYFKGNAPSVYPAQSSNSFPVNITLHCLSTATGWTDSPNYFKTSGTWNGYRLELWEEEDEDDEGGEDEPTGGLSLTGFFTSVNPKEKATVTLSANGQVLKKLTFPAEGGAFAENQAFAFEDLQPAVYTLVIEKPGHLSNTLTDITVTDESVEVGTLPLYAGDLNGDDYIDALDITILSGNLLKTAYTASFIG